MKNKKLLVIIVTYNAMPWIDRCLQSVIDSTIKSDIFLIDNGSTDNTINHIKITYPSIHTVCNNKNIGFGKANNLGIEYAIEKNYDFIYLLNQDAWVFENTFEKIIEQHTKNPEYGILSPLQLEANNRRLDKNFSQNLSKWPFSRNILDLIIDRDVDRVVNVDFAMAAHWMIPRRCFVKVGLFSPSFPHYGEDNNYVHRAIYHGYKIGVVPSAHAVHDREYRHIPINKKIYLEYISAITEISDINDNQPFRIIVLLSKLIIHAVKYRRLLPIKYAWKLLINIRVILTNKEMTRGEGAFIQYESI